MTSSDNKPNPNRADVESKEYYDRLAKQYCYTDSYRKFPWVEYFHLDMRIGGIVAAMESIAADRRIKKAVDVGCGDGILLPFLSKAAEEVTALELSSERLKMAKEAAKGLSNVHFEVGNIMESNSKYREAFDLVVCSEVIEHVRDVELFFGRLAEMVAPGGSLILTTPSRWSVREKFLRIQQIILNAVFNRILKRDVNKYIFFHVGLMTVAELNDLAEKHFSKRELRTVGFYIPFFTEIGFVVGGKSWRRFYKSLDAQVGKSRIDWINWTQVMTATK